MPLGSGHFSSVSPPPPVHINHRQLISETPSSRRRRRRHHRLSFSGQSNWDPRQKIARGRLKRKRYTYRWIRGTLKCYLSVFLSSLPVPVFCLHIIYTLLYASRIVISRFHGRLFNEQLSNYYSVTRCVMPRGQHLPPSIR